MAKSAEQIARIIIEERHAAMDKEEAYEMYVEWIKEYGDERVEESSLDQSLEKANHTR